MLGLVSLFSHHLHPQTYSHSTRNSSNVEQLSPLFSLIQTLRLQGPLQGDLLPTPCTGSPAAPRKNSSVQPDLLACTAHLTSNTGRSKVRPPSGTWDWNLLSQDPVKAHPPGLWGSHIFLWGSAIFRGGQPGNLVAQPIRTEKRSRHVLRWRKLHLLELSSGSVSGMNMLIVKWKMGRLAT